jgi:hypothetical protein
VRHRLWQHFSGEGVQAHDDGGGKEADAGEAELMDPRRRDPENRAHGEVEGGVVERHPGEVGSERPEHGGPCQEGVEAKRGQSADIQA